MIRQQKPARRLLCLEVLEDRFCLSFLPLGTPLAQPDAAMETHASAAYGQLPLSFESNQGQTDTRVNFLSRGSGYTLFLTPNEAVLSLKQASSEDVLRMQLVGANPTAQVAGRDQQSGTSNYLLGNDPSQWHTDIANYGRVEYRNVYAGIDIVYYGNQRQLEYDFIVAPGADPASIRLAFDGAERISLDAEGNLVLHTSGGDLVEHAPVVYQEVDGVRQAVAGRYVLQESGQVGFALGAYDVSQPLTIDPILSYSTYLGGSGADYGLAIAVDGAGSAYVTGIAGSSSFPMKNPMQAKRLGSDDAFVTKFNAAGSALVYSTYLGGSGSDRGYGIAVDGAGNAYVTGFTGSTNFPTLNAFQAQYAGSLDAFVAKLNAGGSALLYSTYLGGAGQENGNVSYRTGGIAVDGTGNAYITGKTSSLNFPTTTNVLQPGFGGSEPGQFDAFVAKIDTTKAGADSRVYATYLGGSGADEGKGIAVDGLGNAHVTGWTNSPNSPNFFRDANGYQATHTGAGIVAFVAKLNGTGSALLYSTYLGGSGSDYGGGIALDASGYAYVTGRTSSNSLPADFPTRNPFQAQYGGGLSDAFVAKLNPYVTGDASLVYSSYLGGSGDDNPNDNTGAIAVDAAGSAYVTGVAYSTNFPTVNAFQTTLGGDYDAFVTKVNPTGSGLVYSSYLGGSSDDRGFGIAVFTNASNDTFAYVTGITASSNFPTVNAFQARRAGGSFPWDAFVTKISSAAALMAASTAPAMDIATATPLTTLQVQPLLDEAIQRRLGPGADVRILPAGIVQFADLPGATLGLASGNSIWLDINAAGWGWFVDATPGDDSEFTTVGNQGEQNSMDLLTVLDHELGHLLGFDHEQTGVMEDTLVTGKGRTPTSSWSPDDVAALDLVFAAKATLTLRRLKLPFTR